MAQGIQIGIDKMKQEFREAIFDLLEVRFGTKGTILIPEILKINQMEQLIALKKTIKICENLEPVNQLIKEYIKS
ncbi:MAG: hypothetical protein HQK76_03860 [Desulfobacterales bacterium]|nr:hypothetical protein [Desulfobacterales bacterium]